MNNKLVEYDDAVYQLQEKEVIQRIYKSLKKCLLPELRSLVQKAQEINREEINYLLSLIHAHKKARKMYGLLKDIQKDLGMSSEAYKRISKVLND